MPGQGRLFAAEGEVVMRRGWKTGYAVLLSVLLGLKAKTLGHPEAEGDHGQTQQQQGKVAMPEIDVPAAQVDDEGAIQRGSQCTHVCF